MTTVKISNLNKKDHPVWKMIGNIAIYGVLPAVVVVAKYLVPDPYKSMVVELSAIILPLIKGATKFTHKETSNQ